MISDIVIIVVVYWVGGTIAGALLGMVVFHGGPDYRKLGARLILTAWAWPAWLASWLALEIQKLLKAAEWYPSRETTGAVRRSIKRKAGPGKEGQCD